jgi:hypothetical protein
MHRDAPQPGQPAEKPLPPARTLWSVADQPPAGSGLVPPFLPTAAPRVVDLESGEAEFAPESALEPATAELIESAGASTPEPGAAAAAEGGEAFPLDAFIVPDETDHAPEGVDWEPSEVAELAEPQAFVPITADDAAEEPPDFHVDFDEPFEGAVQLDSPSFATEDAFDDPVEGLTSGAEELWSDAAIADPDQDWSSGLAAEAAAGDSGDEAPPAANGGEAEDAGAEDEWFAAASEELDARADEPYDAAAAVQALPSDRLPDEEPAETFADAGALPGWTADGGEREGGSEFWAEDEQELVGQLLDQDASSFDAALTAATGGPAPEDELVALGDEAAAPLSSDDADEADTAEAGMAAPTSPESVEAAGPDTAEAGAAAPATEPEADGAVTGPHGDAVEELAERFDRLAAQLRREGIAALSSGLRSGDRLDVLLAGIAAGFLAAGDDA